MTTTPDGRTRLLSFCTIALAIGLTACGGRLPPLVANEPVHVYEDDKRVQESIAALEAIDRTGIPFPKPSWIFGAQLVQQGDLRGEWRSFTDEHVLRFGARNRGSLDGLDVVFARHPESGEMTWVAETYWSQARNTVFEISAWRDSPDSPIRVGARNLSQNPKLGKAVDPEELYRTILALRSADQKRDYVFLPASFRGPLIVIESEAASEYGPVFERDGIRFFDGSSGFVDSIIDEGLREFLFVGPNQSVEEVLERAREASLSDLDLTHLPTAVMAHDDLLWSVRHPSHGQSAFPYGSSQTSTRDAVIRTSRYYVSDERPEASSTLFWPKLAERYEMH